MSAEFAGLLRERLTVERLSDERTDAGVSASRWLTIGRLWGAIVPESVGAESEGMALSAMPRFRVTIRSQAEVAVNDRLRWRGKALSVRQVLVDPRSPERLLLKCEEVRG